MCSGFTGFADRRGEIRPQPNLASTGRYGDGCFSLEAGIPIDVDQTQFHHLIDFIDRGIPVQAVIEAPQIALDPDPGFCTREAAITVRADLRFSPETLAGLRSMGHKVETV